MQTLLSTTQVAERLQISVQRVRQYVRRGRLRPALDLQRRAYYFTEEEVARFAALPRAAGRPSPEIVPEKVATGKPLKEEKVATGKPLTERMTPLSAVRAVPKPTSKPQPRRYAPPSSDDDEPSQAADDW